MHTYSYTNIHSLYTLTLSSQEKCTVHIHKHVHTVYTNLVLAGEAGLRQGVRTEVWGTDLTHGPAKDAQH